jgi:muramoyltetrapeptide carboxypeptidase
MLYALAASGARLVPEGSVLFLEDVTERPYRIDRMLTALRASGALGRASAVVLGDMTECDPGPDGVTADEVLRERTEGLGVPVLRGAPFGHGSNNAPLPLGFSASLSCSREGASISFTAPAG